MSNYSKQMEMLNNEQEFPHGICPFMSKMNVTLAPVAGTIHRPQPELQQVIVFAAAPCVGSRCQLWADGGGCRYAT